MEFNSIQEKNLFIKENKPEIELVSYKMEPDLTAGFGEIPLPFIMKESIRADFDPNKMYDCIGLTLKFKNIGKGGNSLRVNEDFVQFLLCEEGETEFINACGYDMVSYHKDGDCFETTFYIACNETSDEEEFAEKTMLQQQLEKYRIILNAKFYISNGVICEESIFEGELLFDGKTHDASKLEKFYADYSIEGEK